MKWLGPVAALAAVVAVGISAACVWAADDKERPFGGPPPQRTNEERPIGGTRSRRTEEDAPQRPAPVTSARRVALAPSVPARTVTLKALRVKLSSRSAPRRTSLCPASDAGRCLRSICQRILLRCVSPKLALLGPSEETERRSAPQGTADVHEAVGLRPSLTPCGHWHDSRINDGLSGWP